MGQARQAVSTSEQVTTSEVTHSSVCCSDSTCCTHPHQVGIWNFGDGEIVVGHNHAVCDYGEEEEYHHTRCVACRERHKLAARVHDSVRPSTRTASRIFGPRCPMPRYTA